MKLQRPYTYKVQQRTTFIHIQEPYTATRDHKQLEHPPDGALSAIEDHTNACARTNFMVTVWMILSRALMKISRVLATEYDLCTRWQTQKLYTVYATQDTHNTNTETGIQTHWHKGMCPHLNDQHTPGVFIQATHNFTVCVRHFRCFVWGREGARNCNTKAINENQIINTQTWSRPLFWIIWKVALIKY